MAELIEKDPQLAGVVDAESQRNLLSDPTPLIAELQTGTSQTLRVRLDNGVEAPIDLTITSDHPWVEPRRRQVRIVGGAQATLELLVKSDGAGEFANVCFAWSGSTETYSEYIMVWRKMASLMGGWISKCRHCAGMIADGDAVCNRCGKPQ